MPLHNHIWFRVCVLCAVGLMLMGCATARSSAPASQPTAAPAASAAPADTLAAATAMPTGAGLDAQLSLWRAAGREPFCLLLSDTDGDGEKEWVGLEHRLSAGQAGVSGFVLDGTRFFALGESDGGPTEAGLSLGDDAICELSVHDINADGRAEIVAFGQSLDGARQLSLFQWDNAAKYRLLGRFAGAHGVDMLNEDAAGAVEVIVSNRYSGDIVLEEVSVWDGRQFVHSRSRYARQAGAGSAGASSTPEQALIHFYISLQERDMGTAYEYLSPTMRDRQSYEAFLLSQAAVRRFELGEIKRVRDTGDAITLAGTLLLTRVDNARLAQEHYAGAWQMQLTEADWRIDSISLVHGE
jgi:hypothetical protein